MNRALLNFLIIVSLFFTFPLHAAEKLKSDIPSQTTAQAKKAKQLEQRNESAKALHQWATYYYLNQDPDLTPQMIDIMQEQGMFKEGTAIVPITTAFLAQVFQQNPYKISSWMKKVRFKTRDEKKILWQAIWDSGTKPAKEYLLRVMKTSGATSAKVIRHITEIAPLDPLTKKITSPVVLDILWASFFATGDSRYVHRILTVLTWPDPMDQSTKNMTDEQLGQVLIIGSARWSLLSNAVQHKAVYQIIQYKADKSEGHLKKELMSILNKADREINKRAKAASSSNTLDKNEK